VGYALGSIGTAAFGTVPGLLLLYDLTDVLGVAAGIAGLVVFAPKAWDVVLNPWIGSRSDRTESRWGPAGRGCWPADSRSRRCSC
jgi:Na+/melibiose symporter-like transporter